jgi:hypothetical protein
MSAAPIKMAAEEIRMVRLPYALGRIRERHRDGGCSVHVLIGNRPRDLARGRAVSGSVPAAIAGSP